MRPSLKIYEQIDNYLMGKLSKEDKTSFEKEMNNTPELSELVTNQKLIIQAQERAILRREIENAANGGGFHFGKFAGAVSIVVIAFLSYFLLKNDASKDVIEPDNAIVERAVSVSVMPDSLIPASDNPVKVDSSAIVNSEKKMSNHNYSEDTECGGHPTWVAPERQFFNVDPKKGKTIEGEEGMLIIVPSDAFVDAEGNLIKTPVRLELVEALTLEDMVLYDLTTMSDGKALESGGMFYLNATANDEKVNINPERPLYIEIPTNEVKQGMMAFEGEVKEDGSLNWKNPQPLKKYLVKVDLDLLDFLPEGFAAGVEAGMPFRNHKKASDELTDSLYYSLLYDVEKEEVYQNEIEENVDVFKEAGNKGLKSLSGKKIKKKDLQKMIIEAGKDVNVSELDYLVATDLVTDSIQTESFVTDTTQKGCNCGINPLSIKTIRTKAYQETFVATNEFEERIAILHKLDNGQELLDIYLANLGKDLYVSDSLVMTKTKGEYRIVFREFYEQKLTNLKDAQIHQKQLSAYYNKKKKEYSRSVKKIRDELSKKNKEELNALKQELLAAKSDYNNTLDKLYKRTKANVNKNRNSNYEVSLTNKSKTIQNISTQINSNNVVTGSSYAFQWASFGWANIDSYLHMLNKNAKDVDIVVDNTVPQMRVYQWLNAINTLTPLITKGNKSVARFPDPKSSYAREMKSTYCFTIGKNEGQYFWSSERYNPYETTALTASLEPVDLSQIKNNLRLLDVNLNSVLANFGEISKELERAKKVQEEQKRKQEENLQKQKERQRKYEEEQKKIEEEAKKASNDFLKKQIEISGKQKALQEKIDAENRFINKLEAIAFPCNIAEADVIWHEKETIDDKTVYTTVELLPQFPGGSAAMEQFLTNNVLYPQSAIDQGVEGKVFVNFIIDEAGKITNPEVIRGVNEALDAEALRIVNLMPRFIPGMENGRVVKVAYTLPINFKLP